MADQTSNPNRIGFHYYPDTQHYREHDLQTWLPELQALGAGKLVLYAHPERAIPEQFITGLINGGIEPILHLKLPLPSPSRLPSLDLLAETYARWGVRFAVLFDRPNVRQAWAASAWTQSEVVEQFLDMYIPLAERFLQSGLMPVFPPLEPGGDYWDTTFLQAALRSLQRRGCSTLLDSLTLGALAWTHDRPLDWGAGCPQRWPLSYPYSTPPDSQDQRGFHIFDWYMQISASELGVARPIILLQAGIAPQAHAPLVDVQQHAESSLAIAQALAAPAGDTDLSIPEEVLACNFWLLAAAPGSPYANQAWIQPDGGRLPAATALRRWQKGRMAATEQAEQVKGAPATDSQAAPAATAAALKATAQPRPITHYLLVPLYAWGISEWDMESIRPVIEKYHPTVGFSIEEACLADRVTIAGGSNAFSDADFQRLRDAGCSLEILETGGSLVAV